MQSAQNSNIIQSQKFSILAQDDKILSKDFQAEQSSLLLIDKKSSAIHTITEDDEEYHLDNKVSSQKVTLNKKQ